MNCFDELGENARRQFMDYPYAGCECEYCKTVIKAREEKKKAEEDGIAVVSEIQETD
ncbi:MAG: hypothetical protein KAS32_31300 [Candidatus Peribacteraceae bacterium]|nr:hypothetical protein [Candidatus Peribacteraceae bacterium]